MAKIDYNLVYMQAENSRQTLKETAQKLRKSSQRLKYSISVLEKEGVIKEPYCIFDYSYFGLILFRVYFRETYIGEKDKEKVIRMLNNNPHVVSIYEMTGEFDLAVEFAFSNPSKFNKELKKIITEVPTLNNYKITLNLVTHLYPKNYLIKDANLQALNIERIIGGDREPEEFSRNELSVMKNLLLKPKIRYTELAEKSGLNIKTAKSTLRSLVKRNVIKGFKSIIDSNKLNIVSSRLFLKLHNLSIEREGQLMEHMLKTKEIVQVNKTVGDWDMEIDVESIDKSRTRYILMQMRENFKEIIERFSMIEFYTFHKKSYLPFDAFIEGSQSS